MNIKPRKFFDTIVVYGSSSNTKYLFNIDYYYEKNEHLIVSMMEELLDDIFCAEIESCKQYVQKHSDIESHVLCVYDYFLTIDDSLIDKYYLIKKRYAQIVENYYYNFNRNGLNHMLIHIMPSLFPKDFAEAHDHVCPKKEFVLKPLIEHVISESKQITNQDVLNFCVYDEKSSLVITKEAFEEYVLEELSGITQIINEELNKCRTCNDSPGLNFYQRQLINEICLRASYFIMSFNKKAGEMRVRFVDLATLFVELVR